MQLSTGFVTQALGVYKDKKMYNPFFTANYFWISLQLSTEDRHTLSRFFD